MEINLTIAPVAYTAMLIRRPAAEVFNAFIDPEVTSKFWFTKGSDKLTSGGKVTWVWEMYGVSAKVYVKEIVAGKRILVEWKSQKAPTRVELIFTPQGDATFVEVTESGFYGDGDAIVKAALDATGGFTWVLAGAKAWLEHGLRLNLVADRFPRGK